MPAQHDRETTPTVLTRESRRGFLKTSAVLGAGVWTSGSVSLRAAESPNEKLNVALIGIGGRGKANLDGLQGENIVALCDVDQQRAGKAFDRHPQAKAFRDYRKMFDEIGHEIDAVAVSTPDHTHFHPAMIAMELGKHLYCEKPMAHSVDQVRRMTKKASEKKIATQLGVQRHTLPNVHRVVELVKSGVLGAITECHAWVGGDRGMPEIPADRPSVPDSLDWDLWLGQAEARPYSPAYAPYGWRFWWDFGTGETGNWGCHILDIPFWALDLKYPTRVDASGPEPHPQTTPKQLNSSFAFPASDEHPALTLHWYHSKNGPDILHDHGMPHFNQGVVFVGRKGMLLTDFAKHVLFPADRFADLVRPAKSISDSPGFHQEWIQACKGGTAATCNFDYSGPLSETVLLGNVAFRAGGGFDWDAETLTATGNSKAEQFLHSYVRKGWEI